MKLYAMDTCFYSAMGNYTWPVRCEILKELGYDATYLTLFGEEEWDLLPYVKESRKQFELPVEAVYTTPCCSDYNTWCRIADELIPALDEKTSVELAITPSTGNTSDNVVYKGLNTVLEAAAVKSTKVKLYPHIDFWLSTTGQAVQIAKEIDSPLLGVMFCGFHWYAGDRRPLHELLDDAGSRLSGANICGCKPGGLVYDYSIEPLDSGHMDNFLVLSELVSHGYKGAVGLQGYGCGGDVYDYLSRSVQAFRSMEKRLLNHPEWGKYDRHTTSHLKTFRGEAAG